MQQTAIAFDADGLTLEGIVARPSGPAGACPMAVLCHAHPALAGAMEHPLLLAFNKALVDAGIATLRFNFRGVGGSQGEFTNGEREAADVAAAVRLAGHWPGVRRGRVGLVAYSFGAGVVLRGRDRLKGVRAAVLISPPPASLASSRILTEKLPRLFLVGESDRIAQPARLQQLLSEADRASELRVVSGANHAWRGHEDEAARHAAEFLAPRLL